MEARSRRARGDRALKAAGIRTRSRTVAGSGKSAADSRFTWRPAVSTSGSGEPSAVPGIAAAGAAPVPAALPLAAFACLPLAAFPLAADRPGSRTTAIPDRLPPGIRMMSPRRRVCRDRSASARRAADRWRAAAPSSSDSSLRSRAYSAKSPRSQLTVSSASACLARRAWRAMPTTARSAWNWANEDSSRAAARSRPTWPTRFTAML